MTSSRWATALLLALLAVAPAHAGLGEDQGSIDATRVRMHARHTQRAAAQYTLHELVQPDGSRVQQFVSPGGRVFAVRWNTLSKPDLSQLLGTSAATYASAARQAAQRGGIQRHFHLDDSDLLLQSSGHLHVFSGYAVRRSLMPRGLSLQDLGLGQGA